MCKACNKSKFQRIKEGWANLIFENAEVEKIAEKRAHLCASCSKNVFEVCILCGCPLAAKTRSIDEKCDKGLW